MTCWENGLEDTVPAHHKVVADGSAAVAVEIEHSVGFVEFQGDTEDAWQMAVDNSCIEGYNPTASRTGRSSVASAGYSLHTLDTLVVHDASAKVDLRVSQAASPWAQGCVAQREVSPLEGQLDFESAVEHCHFQVSADTAAYLDSLVRAKVA